MFEPLTAVGACRAASSRMVRSVALLWSKMTKTSICRTPVMEAAEVGSYLKMRRRCMRVVVDSCLKDLARET